MQPRWLLGIAPLLMSLACDAETVDDRVTLELTSEAPTQRIDLDPTTVAPEVDNTMEVEVRFAPKGTRPGPKATSIVFTQYRIDFKDGEDEAPFLAGEISLVVAEGSPARIVLRAATETQLSWIRGRHAAGEFEAQARVHLAGIHDGDQAVLVTTEFVATFADYQ